MTKGRILVDMDGVLADFEAELSSRWKQRWPQDDIELYLNRDSFRYDPSLGDIESLAQKFEEIWSETGFFEALPEIDGGIKAIKKLQDLGYDVRIVTSAGNKRKAFSEKANWIHSKLGDSWVRKLVVTRDKYFIDGDVLIDDRLDIDQGHKTRWQHIVYDQPYNRSVTDRPRLSWSDDDWLDTVESTVAEVRAGR